MGQHFPAKKDMKMVAKEIRAQRAKDILLDFMGKCEKAVFFTLTTPDVVDLVEMRRRWRGFRHYLVRLLGKGAKYIMNYEIHPNGHGWHIHSAWNRFIPHEVIAAKLREYGFGRVDYRTITNDGLAEYLTKHVIKAYRAQSVVPRLRLVNVSRGLPNLHDYKYYSPELKEFRRLLRLFKHMIPSDPRRVMTAINAAMSAGLKDSVSISGFIQDVYTTGADPAALMSLVVQDDAV